MNLEFLIAKRVGVASKKSFSRSILRLAVVAVALSMMVMIIATSIVAGFKNTISEKIFGFWGHIHITSNYAPSSYAYESSPMNQNQNYYPSIDTVQEVHFTLPEIDWASSFVSNSHQPLLYIGLILLVMGLLLLFNFKWGLERFSYRSKIITSILLFITASICLAMPSYELVPKEVEKVTQGGIRHIQLYIHKEGIIKTDDQIEGIVLRGVGADYDWEFLKQYIKQGSILQTNTKETSNGVLISETTAQRLHLKVEDTFIVYFIQEGTSLARKFKITGIYKTGLAEYDRRFALVDVRELQELNNWRPYHNYGTELYLEEEQLAIKGLTTATAVDDIGWNYATQQLQTGKVPDLDNAKSMEALIPSFLAQERRITLGDTLFLNYVDNNYDTHTFKYAVSGIYTAAFDPKVKTTLFVNWNSINNLNKQLPPQVSGFEIFVDNIQDIDAFGDYVNYVTLLGKEQYANTIKELEPNIFDWLSLTDMNERIILLLMILVSIINMTTSLMILILERTNMIGILKALGAQNWSIRTIFLYNAAYIIGYGLFWGNLIGIGLCFLQMQFGIITLPEDLYYVSVAPVEINWMTVFLLNVGTMTITLLVLIIPSWLVAKIDPVKAIRFS